MANEMVTRKQAEAVLALVEKKFSSYLKTFGTTPDGRIDFDTIVDVPESDRPHIVEWETDHAGTQLAIVWESGSPDGWAYGDLADTYVDEEVATVLRDEFQARNAERLANVDGVQGMPKGVHAEPYYSFVLVLYKEV
jgi:hypothetical protein